VFWATVAIAEQDFLPGGGGVGDLCLHCHAVNGWLESRSTPTNASGLDPATDTEGIQCEVCHFMTDPDQENTIPNPPEGSYVEEQNSPFLAYETAAGPEQGTGYYGGAEYVLNSGGTRLGPYTDHEARHDAIPSAYHRDARLCGTCHDVSNPVVGDLAQNHGSIAPFTGPFSGVPLGPVADTAALNNPPHTYGIVARTFSEWIASGLDEMTVNSFNTLPADLRVAGGSLEQAYQESLNGTCSGSTDPCKSNADCGGGSTCTGMTADYADGDTRYFTCQTCHMSGSLGKGGKQGPIRGDLPAHDQTGGSYWVADAIQYQDAQGTLVFGSGLSSTQIAQLNAGKLRAMTQLDRAASLSATQIDDELEVRITNLTGHKLISGYPEGRRMWLNLVWRDGGDQVIKENGAYGPLGVTVQDLDGDPFIVQSILAPASTKVYQVKPAMTEEWADTLLAVGYPADMTLQWNRLTNNPVPRHTLGELANEEAGEMYPTFHFALNNAMYKDNRIPPFGYDYDLAYERNSPPMPLDQYGDPGSGGTYDHFDLERFPVPPSAVSVEIHLQYQSTSWEYVQFLWKQNDGLDPFLGQEGVHMLDAWLNNGMCAPYTMTSLTTSVTGGIARVPGETTDMRAEYLTATGEIVLSFDDGCDALDHTVYYGDLDHVASRTYAGAQCFVGVDHEVVFEPGPSSRFFLIVANDGTNEGSYGRDSNGIERGEHTSTAYCDYPQDLTGVTCE